MSWAKDRGWDQAELARRLNTTPQVITNWKARGVPSDQYVAIATLLGRSLDELVLGKAPPRQDSRPSQVNELADEATRLLSAGKMPQAELEAMIAMLKARGAQ